MILSDSHAADHMMHEREYLRLRDERLAREARERPVVETTTAPELVVERPRALSPVESSQNELRPSKLEAIVGQERAKRLLRRVLDAVRERDLVLDHMLLVGPSGTGKTTLGTAIANELGRAVYQVEAPISHDTLMQLREVMRRKDILFIDEIHQQAIMERRGRSSSTQPEVLFNVMEDRTIVTPSGVVPFPAITVIGATTDEGMLPDPFINRFPLRPVLERYAIVELATIARSNSEAFGLRIEDAGARLFASASRGVPRQINNYVRNAALLLDRGAISEELAREVVEDLNRTTEDGLTLDMQNVLTFLYTRCRQYAKGDGEIVYRGSVNTIATAIGKSRDQKAVQLRIEPYLIEKGFLQVGHGGRRLTEAGVERALELIAKGDR